MKNQILIVLAFFFFACGLNAQDKPQDKFQTSHSFQRKITKTIKSDYLLFLPKNYNAKAKKQRWPLILFLHGAGERGTNVWRADIHGPTKYVAEHPDFPFILVSPICPADQIWSNEVLINLLDAIIANQKVDTNRIYLTGLSMGGFGAWSLGLAHPERFAAIVPICGGGDILPVELAKLGYTTPEKKAALKTLPVWAFHGAKDTVIPMSESGHMIEALKLLGVEEIKFTVYPEAQHNSWTETYSNPEVYNWLLEHKRGQSK